ncbi:MAG: hypothetical protein ACLGHC_05015 [Alphaproteobacteria bacterium]
MDPRHFGRAHFRRLELAPADSPSLLDDLRLFAANFAAGFLFVSILIA